MVAGREPEYDRRRHEGPVPSPFLPGHQESQQDGAQCEVQGVRLRLGTDLPDDARKREAEPRHDPEKGRSRQRPDEVDRDRGGRRYAQAREQVHAERRVAERAQEDVRDPREQDVGREAGRMGCAEHRRDDLQLGGIPVADARQHGEPLGDERHDADRQRGQPPPGRPAHHPRMRPQMTPHALTVADRTMRPIASGIAQAARRARSTSQEKPMATRTSANGRTSLLNR